MFNEVQALVTSCIDGYHVCIFAYGQTGSGKTYTMEGIAYYGIIYVEVMGSYIWWIELSAHRDYNSELEVEWFKEI